MMMQKRMNSKRGKASSSSAMEQETWDRVSLPGDQPSMLSQGAWSCVVRELLSREMTINLAWKRYHPEAVQSQGPMSQQGRMDAEGELLESLDRPFSEERCEVLYVGLGCDVAEVCSPPGVRKEIESAGLGSGPVYDIKNGWDLTSKAVQDRVLAEITQQRPELVVLCPPCGPFSITQNMNKRRGSNAWLREQAKARILLRFGVKVARLQLEAGRLYMFEHPVGAWRDRTVQHVSKLHNVRVVRLDQCMVGLRDRVSETSHEAHLLYHDQQPEDRGTAGH